MKTVNILLLLATFFFVSCNNTPKHPPAELIPVIFDTDANNELDDQHALAYLLFNQHTFDIKGITVNATYNGGGIDEHYKEAKRVIELCTPDIQVPLLKGAETNFIRLKDSLFYSGHEGFAAIDFIIAEAKKVNQKKLVILAVGKLTNVALAVEKDPSIISKIRLVWLGSNYPEVGEYNLENDIEAMNFLLSSNIEFEMAVCRYGKPSGTDAVRVTRQQVNDKMAGIGPRVKNEIAGRHGGTFNNFGDYSVSLFDHAEMYGNPPSRSLFDMAAVAIVKNPAWAENETISAPIMVGGQWLPIDENPRTIVIWQNFNAEEILKDFFASMEKAE